MTPTGLLNGRTTIVTGAAQGIGFAIARAFAQNGANVVIADVDAARSAAAAAELGVGGRALGLPCDVTDAAAVDRVLAAAVNAFGGIDVMVNNAGVTRDSSMRKMTEDDFDFVVSVSLKGAWFGTRAASGKMRELGIAGSIINMSSISGKVGNPGQTNYSSAKAGIVGLTKAAAKEVGFAGIRVNALQPGIIDTPLTASLSDEIKAQRLADIPLGRFGRPDEVADVALFLASDLSSYVTGAVIEIAGGRHI